MATRMKKWGVWGVMIATLAIGSSLIAQQPQNAPPPQAGAGQPVAPGVQGAPGAGPAGQQGRGGRGGLGGPQETDPANAGVDFSKRDPVLPLDPEEQLKQFILPPGYRLELVLADPVIKEPTAIAFDGNGRMFVLEDRGYMQDADATNEKAPIGRISMHEDLNNDGAYQKHTVFVDNLVFPRFNMPLGANTIVTMETDADDVFKYTDTNGDGVADKKELFASGFGRSGNVEHQQAFLTWTMDNWLYSTVNAFRARWTPNGILREPTGPNGAQWGVTQDNDGKQFFQGGASGVPANFQFPIVYGAFTNPNQFETDFRIPWGAPVRIADMQGGMPSVRMPDGTLNGVTGSAGNDIYRGDRLPKDLVGDLLYGEPVGRIVRRVRPTNMEGLTQLRNVYKWNEFIKTTDPLFRPVDMATAPDGTIYIVDMYRGIIQQANWSGRGTYLRARINQYELDKVHSHGRIWRLRYDGIERDRTQPRMLNESAAQLVTRLSHPNGWWRDTAQQLLVLKQDKSVTPALQTIVRSSTNLLARFHAMWTLEGLGTLDAALVRQAMKDAEPRMRIQAIRASETLYKGGDRTFAADYRTLAGDSSVDVAIQAMLTLNTLKVPDAATSLRATMAANKAAGVQVVANTILNPGANAGGRGGGGGGRGGPPPFSTEEDAIMKRGEATYTELCFACHGSDGRGEPLPGAAPGATRGPSLVGSPRVTGHRDFVIKTLLHGLTGPIDGERYSDLMIPMRSNSDQWVADVTSYVRNSFGNRATFVTPAEVTRARAGSASRETPWTQPELEAVIPRVLPSDPSWKVTASHNPSAASGALTFLGWSTQAPQEPGMWFQIELPQAANIAEIQFTPGAGAGRGGRGGGGGGAGGGRGGAPAGAPGAAPVAAAEAAPPVPQAPGPEASGFPRAYQVLVSQDGATWSAPVAQGQAAPGAVSIPFVPVQAKFIRITQTATAQPPAFWSMQNLKLLAVAPAGR